MLYAISRNMAGTVARLVLRSIDGILRFPSGEVWVWELVVHHQHTPPLHNHHVKPPQEEACSDSETNTLTGQEIHGYTEVSTATETQAGFLDQTTSDAQWNPNGQARRAHHGSHRDAFARSERPSARRKTQP